MILQALPLFLFPQQNLMDVATIQRIKNVISQTAEATKTISAGFTQEKELSILNDKIISSGKFCFRQENLLRWEYIHPFSYTIIIRGPVIRIKDDDQVREFNANDNPVFAEINRIIVGSVRGTLLRDEVNFKASYFQNVQHYIVTLIPASDVFKESIRKINLYFSKSDFSVDAVELYETGTDRTRITFRDKKINQILPDETFVLE